MLGCVFVSELKEERWSMLSLYGTAGVLDDVLLSPWQAELVCENGRFIEIFYHSQEAPRCMMRTCFPFQIGSAILDSILST